MKRKMTIIFLDTTIAATVLFMFKSTGYYNRK